MHSIYINIIREIRPSEILGVDCPYKSIYKNVINILSMCKLTNHHKISYCLLYMHRDNLVIIQNNADKYFYVDSGFINYLTSKFNIDAKNADIVLRFILNRYFKKDYMCQRSGGINFGRLELELL